MVQRYPYSIKRGKNIVSIVHIDGDRAIFYYFVITKTLNMSNEKWELIGVAGPILAQN